MTAISVEIIRTPGSARLVLRGELDTASFEQAKTALDELLDSGVRRVVVDLRELDFMDSTGVRVLLDGRDKADQLGVEIAIAYNGDPVERILTVSGVTTLFERDKDDPTAP